VGSATPDNATRGGISSGGENSIINSITRDRQRTIRYSTKTKKCISIADCMNRRVFQIPWECGSSTQFNVTMDELFTYCNKYLK